MNHVRATRAVWSRRAIPRRIGQVSVRNYAAEPAPPHPPSSPPNPNTHSPPKERSRVGAYYGTFGSPLLKCFLGALFTYQLTYYAWYKLETIEETADTQTQIRDLQEELREAIEKQRYIVEQKWEEAKEAAERERREFGEAVDAVVEEVREGADEVQRGGRAVGRVAGGGWWPW